MADPLLFLLRMPKTGSRTLRDVVYSQYSPEQVFSGSQVISEGLDDWKHVPARERWSFAKRNLAKRLHGDGPPIDAVTAHMWYGWHELTDRPSKYIIPDTENHYAVWAVRF